MRNDSCFDRRLRIQGRFSYQGARAKAVFGQLLVLSPAHLILLSLDVCVCVCVRVCWSSKAAVTAFKVQFNILGDVDIEYCPEENIEDQWLLRVIFIPLMAVLEGGVRFPLDPFLLRTLSFYGTCLDQGLPNFYRVVCCVSQLNKLYNLNLTHHYINLLYSFCGSIDNSYYLKVQDPRFRLISCLPDSNRNSQGEFIKVSGNWLAVS